jgi:hypothetical protein
VDAAHRELFHGLAREDSAVEVHRAIARLDLYRRDGRVGDE